MKEILEKIQEVQDSVLGIIEQQSEGNKKAFEGIIEVSKITIKKVKSQGKSISFLYGIVIAQFLFNLF